MPYQYPKLTEKENIEQFVAQLEANHAQVINTSYDCISKVIKTELEARNITSLLCGENNFQAEFISPLKN